jgi:hypothetical protein
MLHDLGHARAQLARRQGAQDFGVDPDQARLVEGPHQVLAAGHVHPGLAADARIDHGEKRRRYLDDGNTAKEGRRDEAGQIPRDAAAERDDDRPAVRTGFEQGVVELAHLGQVLRTLAVRNLEALHLETRGTQAPGRTGAVAPRYRRDADDHGPACREPRLDGGAEPVEAPDADLDGVAAVPEVDRHPAACGAHSQSLARIAAATSSTLLWSVSSTSAARS